MAIVSSSRVNAQVAKWVWDREPVIDDDVARTIASWYHSPSPRDEQITHLSHTGEIDNVVKLIDEIHENGSWMGPPTDLAALAAWAESKRGD